MESHHKVSVIRRFSDRTHKEMETISGCQDNFSYNEAKNCFAIADGATQSFYSSIWSKLLVDYFCENPQIDKNNWQEWLELIQQKWLEEVRAELEKAKSGNNLPGLRFTMVWNVLNQQHLPLLGYNLLKIKQKSQLLAIAVCLFFREIN